VATATDCIPKVSVMLPVPHVIFAANGGISRVFAVRVTCSAVLVICACHTRIRRLHLAGAGLKIGQPDYIHAHIVHPARKTTFLPL
jgi:hypothetical protein